MSTISWNETIANAQHIVLFQEILIDFSFRILYNRANAHIMNICSFSTRYGFGHRIHA